MVGSVCAVEVGKERVLRVELDGMVISNVTVFVERGSRGSFLRLPTLTSGFAPLGLGLLDESFICRDGV